jgi:hypothetical protein
MSLCDCAHVDLFGYDYYNEALPICRVCEFAIMHDDVKMLSGLGDKNHLLPGERLFRLTELAVSHLRLKCLKWLLKYPKTIDNINRFLVRCSDELFLKSIIVASQHIGIPGVNVWKAFYVGNFVNFVWFMDKYSISNVDMATIAKIAIINGHHEKLVYIVNELGFIPPNYLLEDSGGNWKSYQYLVRLGCRPSSKTCVRPNHPKIRKFRARMYRGTGEVEKNKIIMCDKFDRSSDTIDKYWI